MTFCNYKNLPKFDRLFSLNKIYGIYAARDENKLNINWSDYLCLFI